MGAWVGDEVALGDDALGVDQVADALGEVGVGVSGVPERLVGPAHELVGVGQEAEREVELLGERLVVGWCVERNAEDGAVGVGVLLGLITQALSLERSTGGVGLRIPPEQNPPTAFVGETRGDAVLVRHREVRCGDSWVEHE